MNIKNNALFLIYKLKEEDKRKHLIWSFWIAVLSLVFFGYLISFSIAFLIGVVKEIWDHYYGSGFCFYDMTANCVGIFMAFFLNYFFMLGFSLV